MVTIKVPDRDDLTDGQLVQIQGPDGTITTYQYNAETNTLIQIPGEVIIPSSHGNTHVSSDLVPIATTSLQGHMSAADKARLDALVQMRVGVLGFVGAGFPDDGGWIQGDLILAAGSEFISLERIGNVIRLTVDSPIPLNCGCEECAEIFWVQDETDTTSIRPPSCNGKLPGANVYGEMKIYLLPESTIVDPANPAAVLRTKVNFPSMVFKRYDDGILPGQAEFEMVLARRVGGTTKVGWALTPGPQGIPECVWFMGDDDDGNEIRFELNTKTQPGMLGALLFKGHTLTRRPAVITNFTASILSTNQYLAKYWDILNQEVVANTEEFVATNHWRFENPENSTSNPTSPKALVLDSTRDLLPIGTLIQLWEFQIGEVNGEPILSRFFIKEPNVNPSQLWCPSGAIIFGDRLTARDELGTMGTGGTEQTAFVDDVSDFRLFERTIWGITGFEDPMFLSNDQELDPTDGSEEVVFTADINDAIIDAEAEKIVLHIDVGPNDPMPIHAYRGYRIRIFVSDADFENHTIYDNSGTTVTICGTSLGLDISSLRDFWIFRENTNEPSGIAINDQYVADIDPSIPALKVSESNPTDDIERPVYLWHRINHKNFYMRALIGQPDDSRFPPYDVLLRAPIDSFDDVYLKIIKRGRFTTGPFMDSYYAVVKGAHWKDIPRNGHVRVIYGNDTGAVWQFISKAAFYGPDDDAVILIGNTTDEFPLFISTVSDESSDCSTTTTIVKLLHHDYTAPALRLEFSINETSGSQQVQMQFRAGTLDMSEAYELDIGEADDDFVRGLTPGFAISQIYTQNGFITNGETPSAIPEDFSVVVGGRVSGASAPNDQRWNLLEIMVRDDQLWVFWNGLLIPPDAQASATLPTPVAVNTPYFPFETDQEWGKVGFRLWPGAIVRQVEIRDQAMLFSEFSNGSQLEIA